MLDGSTRGSARSAAVDALGGHIAIDRIDAFEPLRPLIDVDESSDRRPSGGRHRDLQIVVAFLHDEARRRRRRKLPPVFGGAGLVPDRADRPSAGLDFAPFEPGAAVLLPTARQQDSVIEMYFRPRRRSSEAGGDDNVIPVALTNCATLIYLNVAEVSDKLRREIAGRLAAAPHWQTASNLTLKFIAHFRIHQEDQSHSSKATGNRHDDASSTTSAQTTSPSHHRALLRCRGRQHARLEWAKSQAYDTIGNVAYEFATLTDYKAQILEPPCRALGRGERRQLSRSTRP